ncbi:hypothetical protein LXA43DRAFT_904965 [Ganoderma leucocontextum]|nr:hypothetical protein LXA43DRAFT_904965 [Ganoderma leucocontextum]
MPAQVPFTLFPTNLPSFGFAPPPGPWFAGIPTTHLPFRPIQSIPCVHPLLGGEYGRQPKIIFDLSLNTFGPQYITRSGSHGSQLRLEELSEPAIHPPVHRMEIVCDDLLEWPIIIERRINKSKGGVDMRTGNVTLCDAPITVYDVLTAIHRTLHTQISRRDWDKLLGDRRQVVLEAYTRRCRRYIGFRWIDDVGGIRRVDYLRDSYMFGGIVCECARDGVAEMRLLLSIAK